MPILSKRKLLWTPYTALHVPAAAGGGAYAGMGDVVTGAAVAWGFRAYTLASIGGNAVTLRRVDNDSDQTFATIAGGGLDLSAIATFLSGTTGRVKVLFDQTGGGRDLTQSTTALMPIFTPSATGGKPGMTFTGTEYMVSVGGNLTIAQPITFSMVAMVTSACDPDGVLINDTGSNPAAVLATGSNGLYIFAGGSVTGAAADDAFHALQGIINGASSDAYIDGASNTGNPGSQTIFSASIYVGRHASGILPFTGVICEAGIWNDAFASTKSTMNSNQQAYWI